MNAKWGWWSRVRERCRYVIQKPTARTYLAGQVPPLAQTSDMTLPPRRILCVSSLCSAPCGKILRYKRRKRGALNPKIPKLFPLPSLVWCVIRFLGRRRTSFSAKKKGPGINPKSRNQPQASMDDNRRKAFMYGTNFRSSKKYSLFRNRPVIYNLYEIKL